MEKAMKAKSDRLAPSVPMIGHQKDFALFERIFNDHHAAHAYLITGPQDVGKVVFALHLAGLILQSVAEPTLHPDFLLIERGLDPKTNKPRAIIALDQIQALCTKLSRKSFLGGWQVAVIRDVHLLNTSAANALLKTLEEPHAQTLLLLTAPDINSVLPTVRSRCQEIKLQRVPRLEIEEALIKQGSSTASASLLARLANGCPLKAWRYATDQNELDRLNVMRQKILELAGVDYATRWQVIEQLLPKKLVFQESGFLAQEFLTVAAELLRDALLLRNKQSERLVHIDMIVGIRRLADSNVDLPRVLEELSLARQRIKENVNPRNALRQFVLQF
jgi:DNA polymerase-3 subunit delta'